MPASDVDGIETSAPGWILGQLTYWSSQIDSRLAKRYAVPFPSPYPTAVTGWLARIVTQRLYIKRGVDSTDAQYQVIADDAKESWAEIKEAADAVNGLFELPSRADVDADGVVRGGPVSYSEASPYVGWNVQGNTGRNEDSNGSGTLG
jgi:hypothetical protein